MKKRKKNKKKQNIFLIFFLKKICLFEQYFDLTFFLLAFVFDFLILLLILFFFFFGVGGFFCWFFGQGEEERDFFIFFDFVVFFSIFVDILFFVLGEGEFFFRFVFPRFSFGPDRLLAPFFDHTVLCPNLWELWPMGLLFGTICCSCLDFWAMDLLARDSCPRPPCAGSPVVLCGVSLLLCCVVLCCVLCRCGVCSKSSSVRPRFGRSPWLPFRRTPSPDFPSDSTPLPRLPLPFAGPPKISLFFSLSRNNFILSSSLGGRFVEFWWCLKRRDPQMCTFGVLGLSCETPAALAIRNNFTIDLPPPPPPLRLPKKSMTNHYKFCLYPEKKPRTQPNEIPRENAPSWPSLFLGCCLCCLCCWFCCLLLLFLLLVFVLRLAAAAVFAAACACCCFWAADRRTPPSHLCLPIGALWPQPIETKFAGIPPNFHGAPPPPSPLFGTPLGLGLSGVGNPHTGLSAPVVVWKTHPCRFWPSKMFVLLLLLFVLFLPFLLLLDAGFYCCVLFSLLFMLLLPLLRFAVVYGVAFVAAASCSFAAAFAALLLLLLRVLPSRRPLKNQSLPAFDLPKCFCCLLCCLCSCVAAATACAACCLCFSCCCCCFFCLCTVLLFLLFVLLLPLSGSPTVEPNPCRFWPSKMSRTIKQLVRPLWLPKMSRTIFCIPKKAFCIPKDFCITKKSLWCFVSRKKTFVPPKKRIPSLSDPSSGRLEAKTCCWSTTKKALESELSERIRLITEGFTEGTSSSTNVLHAIAESIPQKGSSTPTHPSKKTPFEHNRWNKKLFTHFATDRTVMCAGRKLQGRPAENIPMIVLAHCVLPNFVTTWLQRTTKSSTTTSERWFIVSLGSVWTSIGQDTPWTTTQFSVWWLECSTWNWNVIPLHICEKPTAHAPIRF